MLAGLIMPRRALLVGFVYVLVWEGIAAGFSTSLETWSVRRYVAGALHAALGSSPLASEA
jgi:predicted MFS family arabinose efflux permease